MRDLLIRAGSQDKGLCLGPMGPGHQGKQRGGAICRDGGGFPGPLVLTLFLQVPKLFSRAGDSRKSIGQMQMSPPNRGVLGGSCRPCSLLLDKHLIFFQFTLCGGHRGHVYHSTRVCEVRSQLLGSGSLLYAVPGIDLRLPTISQAWPLTPPAGDQRLPFSWEHGGLQPHLLTQAPGSF